MPPRHALCSTVVNITVNKKLISKSDQIKFMCRAEFLQAAGVDELLRQRLGNLGTMTDDAQ